MPAPTVVNSSTGSFTLATSATVNLPGSRVIGNILIAWIAAASGTNSISIDSGFTLIAGTDTTGRLNLAYRIIDGTEASSLTWTFTTAATITSGTTGIVQISGNRTSAPIGAFAAYCNDDPGTSISTLVAQTIKTAGASSMILAILDITGSATPGLPANYTNITTVSNASVATRACYETLGVAYTAMDPISESTGAGPSHWEATVVEILSAAPVPPLPEIGYGGGGQGWTTHDSASGSNTGTLPPIVTGDLLIAAIFSPTPNTAFSWPAGWTPFASVTGASALAAQCAWALGSASAPVVGVSPVAPSRLCITAIRNVPTGSPIGAFNVNGNTGTTASCLAITTERNNSIVLGIIGTQFSDTPPSSGYIQSAADVPGAGPTGLQAGWEFVQVAGSLSDPISVAVSSGLWAAFIIEIPGFAAGHSFGTIIG